VRPLAPLLIVSAVRKARSEVRKPGMTGKSDLNGAIARLAGRQGGHVTRKQLLELGLRTGAIEARIEAGRLLRVHRGVYAVGHLPTAPLDRARAALLAIGPRCALSGRSAAALWGLYSRWSYPIEVVSPLRHRLTTVKAHRCRTLLQRDIRLHHGLTVTSPARTVLDIAPHTATKALHRFHNELRMRKLINNEQLVDVALRNPRHPGAKRLLALAGASKGAPKRSGFEIDWLPFASKYGLPAYEMNIHVAGQRIDVLFTPDRLIVELDGWGSHGTKRAFEDDRDQDSGILAATGIPTMRITHDGLHLRPREQVRRINAILARR
jgi:hypothetical protein